MFQDLTLLPPDAILGVTAAFKADPSASKVDLGVGVYRDDKGRTPVPKAVRQAELEMLEAQTTKTYLSPIGNPVYNTGMAQLVLGDTYAKLRERIALVQAPGGSGALRVGADLLKAARADAVVYLSDPTWASHRPLLSGAGLKLETNPYYDNVTHRVDFAKMLTHLNGLAKQSAVLIHGCCHNPTGADLTPTQWKELAAVISERELFPYIDLAYHGLGEDLERDAAGTRLIASQAPEALIAVSCSKTFGLYKERVGMLIALTPSAAQAKIVDSQVSRIARTLYSMPPDHGAAIVAHMLGKPALMDAWKTELTEMAVRIRELRKLLAAALSARSGEDFSWIASGRGMFSQYSALAKITSILQERHHIYIAPGGRINMAGLTTATVDQVADAITTCCFAERKSA